MKRAVSISLGSSQRDKSVKINLKGQEILVERVGTDGDIPQARKMYLDLDGKVDAFGVGGVDLYLRLDDRNYPLHAALKLVSGVKQTPLCDGRGLKHTLERRVFELARPQLGETRFKQAFVPVAIDRLGLAQAVSEVRWDRPGRPDGRFGSTDSHSWNPLLQTGGTGDAAVCQSLPNEHDLLWQRWSRAKTEICEIL